MIYPLDERIKEIRDLINKPHKQNELLGNDTLWLMLCSCMDTIQDTEVALESYLTEDIDNSYKGKNYLNTYGALQALFVQQDAVENLHTALGIPYIEDSSLEQIREIRNDAAGHPTNRRNKKSFNFVHFGSGYTHGFHLMTVYPNKTGNGQLNSKHADINLADLITTQRRAFMEILDNVIETLKAEEVAHKNKFSGKKLVSVFSGTTYPFSKIWDAILRPNSDHAYLVDHYVKEISECIEAFKDGLKERGEPDDHISDRYEKLEYALQHIKAFFDGESNTHTQREDVHIFVSFVDQQLKVLKEIAEELDKEYSQ